MLIAYLSVDIYYIEGDVAGNTKSASSVHNFKPKFEIIYVKYVDFSTLREKVPEKHRSLQSLWLQGEYAYLVKKQENKAFQNSKVKHKGGKLRLWTAAGSLNGDSSLFSLCLLSLVAFKVS